MPRAWWQSCGTYSAAALLATLLPVRHDAALLSWRCNMQPVHSVTSIQLLQCV
jgi:hypothetical protein